MSAPAPTIASDDGLHLLEWRAELIGTGLLMFAVVTAKTLAVRAGVDDITLRVAIVAVVAGAIVPAVAFSSLGRRSGAHLNPAVTLGLHLQGVVGRSDLAGYCVAQCVGGIAGVAAGRAWGHDVAGATIDWALIAPAGGVGAWWAAGIEAVATFAQLVPVFAVLTSERLHQWAAPIAGLLLAVTIVGLAQVSGAGFNPVRGLAPDVLAGDYPAWWIYVAGPLAGGAAAAWAVKAWGRLPLTGKLHHDGHVPCHMRCSLPHSAATLDPETAHDPSLLRA